jgi:hypothetical protein
MPLSILSVLRSSARRALFLNFGLIVFLAGALNSGSIALAQEGSELTNVLNGHWRNTKIVFEKPQDTHLVLHPDGMAETWIVTATQRDQKTTGRWSSNGKTLTLAFGDGDARSYPFTFYKGQLVLPNIPNKRQFWERIERP